MLIGTRCLDSTDGGSGKVYTASSWKNPWRSSIRLRYPSPGGRPPADLPLQTGRNNNKHPPSCCHSVLVEIRHAPRHASRFSPFLASPLKYRLSTLSRNRNPDPRKGLRLLLWLSNRPRADDVLLPVRVNLRAPRRGHGRLGAPRGNCGCKRKP